MDDLAYGVIFILAVLVFICLGRTSPKSTNCGGIKCQTRSTMATPYAPPPPPRPRDEKPITPATPPPPPRSRDKENEGDNGMTDREKLIRGLQNRINESRNRGGIAVPVALSTLSEALMAVREQEPVEPDAILTNPVCGVCDEPLDVTDEYCRHCGRPIKWRC